MKLQVLWALLGLFVWTGCSNPSPKVSAMPAYSVRGFETFMPGAETVEVVEDFSKDPHYATLAEALEALDRDQAISTQSSMGPDQVQIRTHTFSNGETYTYTAYKGIVFDADVILGTTTQLQADFAAYEAQLSGASNTLSPQGAMYKPYCASGFLVICGERWGGGWPDHILWVDTNSLRIFTSSQQTLIKNTLADLDRRTNIRVGYRTTGDRVMLTNRNDGCYAVPGRSSSQPQNLNLGPGCFTPRTIMHEFGHALGLMHEHQRTDRDAFIVVNWSNLTSKGRGQFERKFEHESRTTYDYASVMHYRRNGSSDFVRSTLEPMFTIIGSYDGIVGGDTLSSRDIQAINTRYR